MKRYRIFKDGDNVIFNLPSCKKYQTQEMWSKCRLPNIPGIENMEYLEIEESNIPKVVQNQKQFRKGDYSKYYIENGELKVDYNWEEKLMPLWVIKRRHWERCQKKKEEELSRATPNVLKIIKLQNDQELCSMPEKEVLKSKEKTKKCYQWCLDNIKEDGLSKPKIEKKLKSKIAELT